MKIPPEQQYQFIKLSLPGNTTVEGCHKVLLHACCAPCSAAIVECMLRNGMQPTVFFSNANIYPLEEYEHRKQELMRFLASQGVSYVEDEYDHEVWRKAVEGFENEPERGGRCSVCFRFRLQRAARYAQAHGFRWLTTTLASSRWKNIDQINRAGNLAVMDCPDVEFWEQNWRKGGLQMRRGELLRINAFYNQQYCGCEFSQRGTAAEEQTSSPRP